MNELVVAEAARLYGTTPDRLKPLAGGHSTAVYEVVLEGTPCVLRIVPPGAGTDSESVRAIHAWTTYLAEHGAPVPRPVSTPGGDPISVIAVGDQRYTVVATTKARGVLAETLRQDQWTSVYFHNIGAVAGKIHTLAESYVPAAALRRPAWNETGDLFSVDQPADPVIKVRKREILEQIRALPKDPLTFGMIHGDFHFGNFFVDPDEAYAITLFDFDDCAYGWYIFDTAILLFDILVLYEGTGTEQFAAQFLETYLKGYRTQKQLDAVWLGKLPLFLKLLEISYYTLLEPTYRPGERSGDFWVDRFMPGRRERVTSGIPYVGLDFDDLARL